MIKKINLLGATVILLSLFWILPLIGIIMVSFRPYKEVINGWWDFSSFTFSFKNYRFVLFETSLPMIRSMFNSFWSSALGSLFPALLGSMTAYAFSRHYIPKKSLILTSLLVLMAIPGQMIAIPVFKIMNQIRLLDKLTGIVLLNTVTALPWIIFFMLNFINSQNISIEEAARIDGASDYVIFRCIVLPQSISALISVGLLQFVWSWNSFFWPLICLYDPRKLVATQIIPMLRGQFLTDWGALAAASILVVSVPLILFMTLQKYYIRGSVGWSIDK